MSSIDTTTTNCASCGKEGGNLNTCNKCKMVKYCNAACKKKHQSKHKKQCKRRVAELHYQALFKEPPPRDECPICFLPHDARQTMFSSCCGKLICRGCIYAMDEEARGRGGEVGLCSFCRTPDATSEEEQVNRTKKLMDANNAHAFYNLAGYYNQGIMGMPRNNAKANELWLRAGELGYAYGYYSLGNSYYNGDGVQVDEKKAKYYYELAATNGCVEARHNLGGFEERAGNYHLAMRHFILAARAGFQKSLDAVKAGFMTGLVTKDEYANSLRAHQERYNEMKSEHRDKADLDPEYWI